MANDAKFNFYLNRQGARGQKGEKGDQGFSPSITVNTDTADEYTLLVQNEYDSFVTDNIRPTYDDRGGTYVRVDRDNNVQYFGSADIATTANYGEVKLAQASDLASTVDVGNSNVITVELLKTWFGGQIADNLVTTTNNVTIQGQKIFATPTRFMDTVRIGNRLMVTQDDTGTITFDTDKDGTLIGTDATFKKDVRVNGGTLVDGNLHVSGATRLSGNADIFGTLDVKNGLTVQTGGVKVQGGELDVTGRNTITQNVILSSGSLKRVKGFSGYLLADTSAILPEEYITVGDERLPLRLVGTKVLANGKDVATADTVEAMQSDLNIAKQDIIEAQGDIDNLQMNKQNKLTAGTGITIDADNVISATGGVVDLPIASSTTLGGIKVGENLTISEDGTLSATGGGSSVTYTAEAPLSISADNVISIDTTDLGGTTLKKDASMNVDYALDLTANGTVGSTSKAARAESNESRHDAYMAFSGHNPSDAISTLWGPSSRKANSWVELYVPEGIIPASAAWTYGSTNEILPAVELLASNDGSSYTSLGSVTGVSTVTASMTFNTNDSYKYLRFKFRDSCVSSAWGKFGLTSLKVKSSEVATYTELFIGDNIDVTNGVMNVNSLSGEVNTLSGDVTTLSGKVTAVEGKTTDLESAVENKQDKLTAGQGISIVQKYANELEKVYYDSNGNVLSDVSNYEVKSGQRNNLFVYDNLNLASKFEFSVRIPTSVLTSSTNQFAVNFSSTINNNINSVGIQISKSNAGLTYRMGLMARNSNWRTNSTRSYGSVPDYFDVTVTRADTSTKILHVKFQCPLDSSAYEFDWDDGTDYGGIFPLNSGGLHLAIYMGKGDPFFGDFSNVNFSYGSLGGLKTTISSTTPITYLTSAQYDALEAKDANTMYVITDDVSALSDNGGAVSREEFDALVARVAALEASINGGQST